MTPIFKTRRSIIPGNNSGMALLVVLAVISVLMAAALQLARTTGTSALAIGRSADQFLAHEQARAGITLAMAILAEDAAATDTDSIQENWANPEKLAAAVSRLGYEDKTLILEIQDELGKLQINALLQQYPGREMNPDQYRIWERFFESATGKDEEEQNDTDQEAAALVNSLIDWLDDLDDEAVTGLSGAESDYYLSLDTPYACGNGPFFHPGELFWVKGMKPDLFKGPQDNDADPNPDQWSSRHFGIQDLITVHGIDTTGSSFNRAQYPGRVNINTASENVLKTLLPPSLADLAEELAAHRKEKGQGEKVFLNPLDKGWVTKVIEMSEKEKQTLDRSIQYKSDCFRVLSTAVINKARVALSAIIRREQDTKSGRWRCRIMQMEKN